VYFRGVETIDLDPALLEQPGYLASRLLPGAWVALDTRRPHTNALSPGLAAAGYQVVTEDDAAHYRVWRPSGASLR
jgi:hypothetical protein